MANRVLWKGESRSFCTSCGAIFSSEAVISEASKSDGVWHLGAPSKLGEYWIVLRHNPKLPIRADIWVKQGEEVVTFAQKEIPLNQLKMNIAYHQTFVLPCPPGGYEQKGCTGSD